MLFFTKTKQIKLLQLEKHRKISYNKAKKREDIMLKKTVSLLIIISLFLSFSACIKTELPELAALRKDLDSNPAYTFYHSLSEEDKDIYTKICYAIENYDTEKVYIGGFNSEADHDELTEHVTYLYEHLVYEQAQYFWADTGFNGWEFNNKFFGIYFLFFTPTYIVSEEELPSMKQQFDSRVDAITAAANEKEDTFGRVLYIYDEILSATEYDDVLAEAEEGGDLERTAYGSLVTGKTVCSGYATALSLLMSRLGIENGVEFSSYHDENHDDRHVWNYALLDGEYYYFDATWDDTYFASSDISPYIEYAHCYFGLTTKEFGKTHTFSDYSPAPECNGTEYNYFLHNGYNISEYTFRGASDILEKFSDGTFAAIRFDTEEEMEEAKADLLDREMFFSVFEDMDTVNWMESESKHHLYFFFTDKE